MMHLVFAFLPYLATVVDKPPPAPPAPPPLATACAAPSGKLVFEIDSTSDVTGSGSTTMIKLYANGTWTRTSGKVIPQVGCVDPAAVKKREKAIAAAPWTITHPKIRCMAKAVGFSEYKLAGPKGPIVYRSEMCGNDILDAKSAEVLATALDLVAGATAAATPSSST